ncbi:hypothetical protein ABIF65_007403 [Bradyrhizobium japonicum]|jgi:hypothetical protein|uniref:hypothetical protein n=1 Tax=Bradyrhizobium TaxID=374 RepID=UPI00041D55B9|nr:MULTISPECIES: hypothetical protein [Bradyrhizobium]MBR0948700.1 hypothetical protein [Bradyrhizobium liaoningense]MBR1002587.1 hypothetical protein [Bradyrhizobium liaoningense]MBR1068923.1 hypothetical protein [Bradyrhizobium liaoningense]MCP1745728.1 hypothetical protein [Bradyrhizobium japonicum]MCP1775421.1 hypothetical protein [Bradyrhizobium japonicum]
MILGERCVLPPGKMSIRVSRTDAVTATHSRMRLYGKDLAGGWAAAGPPFIALALAADVALPKDKRTGTKNID